MSATTISMVPSLADVDLLEPNPECIHIEDIARGLAHIARFNGSTTEPYSVAAHSVVVSALLGEQSREIQLAGLMHDASEAYLGDVVAPLKRTELFRGYRELEERWNVALERRFGLSRGIMDGRHVKAADELALAAEMQIFRPIKIGTRPLDPTVAACFRLVHPFGRAAEEQFLARFKELTET